jgi:hypothetical protein
MGMAEPEAVRPTANGRLADFMTATGSRRVVPTCAKLYLLLTRLKAPRLQLAQTAMS